MWREGAGLEYTTLVVIPRRVARRPVVRSRWRVDQAKTLLMKQSALVIW